MKKKKTVRLSVILVLAVLLMLPLSAAAAERPALHGTLSWTDEDNHAGLRPDSVTVKLFADGTQIAETQAVPDDWSFAFWLDNVQSAEYTVSAELPVGYEEAAETHADPSVRLTEAALGTWTKYEPCCELSIPTSVLSSYIIAGKLTERQTAVIWSSQPLTESEQSAVLSAFRGQPGVGKLSDVTFISGDGASERGMTVSSADGFVSFEAPSNWALLFGAAFEPARYEVQNAAITLRLIPVLDGPVTPPDDVPVPESPEEPGPGIDVEQEPEQQPDTEEEPPKKTGSDADIEQKPEPEPEKKSEPTPPKGPAPEPEKEAAPKPTETEQTPETELMPDPAPDSDLPVQPKQDTVPESHHEAEEYTAPQPSPKPEAENKTNVQSPVIQVPTQATALDEQPKTGMPVIYTTCEIICLAFGIMFVILFYLPAHKKERR